VGAVVVDPDGVYDPALINDRLLLGLKGTMSEFELNVLRQRSWDAIRQKASRGELRMLLPIGLCWTASGRIELDPDRRVQQAIHLVFTKMTELGSARQVLLWYRQEQISLPAFPRDPGEPRLVWKLPVYHSILAILTNPMYAGAYVFGKTEARTRIVEGRARKTVGHRKPRSAWTVLLRDHHPAYISWAQYEGHPATIAANTHMKSRMERKAGRGGRALLAGLLRCRRCGRMLRYEAVDPDNRLVAAELEARWNDALQKARVLTEKLEAMDRSLPAIPIPDRAMLLSLAQDLPTVWHAPATDMRLKQRIVRILIQEIVADVEEAHRIIVLVIHWTGGRHSELRVKANEKGHHGRCTSLEALGVVRQMAMRFSDQQIAVTLNRLGLLTGNGNTWTEGRVCAARGTHGIPACDRTQPREHVTLEEAAQYLGVSATTVRRLITTKQLPARQVVPFAPWEISREALTADVVRRTVTAIKHRVRAPQTHATNNEHPMFSEG
jgi:excisionase family DNA binding protein